MKINKNYVFAVLIVICGFMIGVMGCRPDNKGEPIIMKYSVGEVVKFKVDGRRAVVIRMTDYDMEYKVSFAQESMRNPYKKKWVKEIELESVLSDTNEDSIFFLSQLTKRDSVISELINKLVEADEFKARVEVLIGEIDNEN